jgi:hypothetical protein
VPVVGDLVIDEILANPTGQDLGREWVEIASRALDPLELSSLHIQAVAMGALVIEQVQLAVNAYSNWDRATATLVLERERKINLYDTEIEEAALQVIARRQPVAQPARRADRQGGHRARRAADRPRLGCGAGRLDSTAFPGPRDRTRDPFGRLAAQMIPPRSRPSTGRSRGRCRGRSRSGPRQRSPPLLAPRRHLGLRSWPRTTALAVEASRVRVPSLAVA